MRTASQIILHLTDLHFGCDKGASEVAARALALGGLLNALHSVEQDWKPTILCVTGDIGWKCLVGDYEQAQTWLKTLIDEFEISQDRVVLCAGNHDINRNVSQKYARPKDGPEADRILATPIAGMYKEAFAPFCRFAEDFSIPPYAFGSELSHLTGERVIEGISFCALNSAWFCQGPDDKGNLWVGKPHIDILEHSGQLSVVAGIRPKRPVVVLLHHPREWLNDEEIHARGLRPNTFDLVAQRSHLMLTGHVHGESRRADRYAEGAFHLSGGATYAGSDYNNGFTLIKVADDHFVYRTFEYDPRSADRKWQQTIPATRLVFFEQPAVSSVGSVAAPSEGLASYRAAAEFHASRVVEAKSRALRPWGRLPALHPLNVLVHTAGVRPQLQSLDRADYKKEVVEMPLLQAARTSRRLLLLGDLGSGKSTIAASYAVDLQNSLQNSLAIFVPAKAIETAQPSAATWQTSKAFVQRISHYFQGEVCPASGEIDVQSLLESRAEVALIVDGLDEVQPAFAQRILNQLANLADHWPSVHVLATGRPAELTGVDYSKWKVCSVPLVTDSEKLSIFAEEAIADGKSPEQGKHLASIALQRLRSRPDLHSVASTPLFCRILFARLEKAVPQQSHTLGDLLYDLVRERILEWSKQDVKASPTPLLDFHYPDSDSRISLLSKLALKCRERHPMFLEEARLFLDKCLPSGITSGRAAIVDEALRSFTSAGLITAADEIQFPLRVFEEFCCGYGRVILASKTGEPAMPGSEADWRIASFAATMARRLGLSGLVRVSLNSFVGKLLMVAETIPAASYVVSEFQDLDAASAYVDGLSVLGPRPIWFSFQTSDWRQVAHAVADCLRLAGKKGFKWFFEAYLNPRYPFAHTGSKLPETVFEEWAALHVNGVPNEIKPLLASVVRPNIAAASQQVINIIPPIAILVPEEFQKHELLWFCIRLLHKEQFCEAAERHIRLAIASGDGEIVRQFLLITAATGHEDAHAAAALYFSLFDEKPSEPLILASLRPGRGDLTRAHTVLLEELNQRLGRDCVLRLCRWYLFYMDSKVAAGAAMELYKAGIKSLALLGTALLGGLHDGGYLREAEDILEEIVSGAGADGTLWIAFHISKGQRSTLDGAHSGWWRILLSTINSVGTKGPKLLADCTRGIGPYLIPRHPEIRQRFEELLSNEDSAFRAALRENLNHPDPAMRHGAAMILVTADPLTEASALEEALRLTAREGMWLEWENFCLTLAFGPSVTAHLKSKLGTMPRQGLTLALAILHQNGTLLTPEEFRQLVIGDLDGRYGVVESDDAFAVVLQVAQGHGDASLRASEALLDRFSAKLTEEQRIRALLLTLRSGSWRMATFYEEFRRMLADPEYLDRVEQQAAEIAKAGGPKPLLVLVHEATKLPELWSEIVWNEVCNEGISFDLAQRAQWLVDLVREFPLLANPIGAAARVFLFDPRIELRPVQDATTWLALLADEGKLLSETEIERSIDGRYVIYSAALVSLIARLGRVPGNMRPRHVIGLPPPAVSPPVAAMSSATMPVPPSYAAALLEFARPSEGLHPGLCPTIEKSLFVPPLDEEELEAIAQRSHHGTLTTCVLATLYGQSPKIEWVLRLIGYRFPTRINPQDTCLQRLIGVWRAGVAVAKEDEHWRSRYIDHLKQGFQTESESTALAAESLALCGEIKAENLPVIFRRLANDVFDDYRLTAGLSEWLSKSIPPKVESVLEAALEEVLSKLDGQSWNPDDSYPRDSGPFLIFPLLYWRIGKKVDDRSKRVFLRGLKMSMTPEREVPHRDSRWHGLEDVAPLLETIPKHILTDVIRYGETIDDLTTRSLSRLFVLGN